MRYCAHCKVSHPLTEEHYDRIQKSGEFKKACRADLAHRAVIRERYRAKHRDTWVAGSVDRVTVDPCVALAQSRRWG